MIDPTVTLLMTRPRAASARFVEALSKDLLQQVTVCYSPLVEIVPMSQPINYGDADAILFTSANGVATAAAGDLPCFCVGKATTLAAQNAGWVSQYVGQTSDEMVAWALQAAPRNYLHLCGAHSRGDIVNRFVQMGRSARAQVIYNQTLLALNDQALGRLNTKKPVIAPVFSPRTARHFAGQITGIAPIYGVAISAAAAEPLRTTGIRALYTADHPTADAMKSEVEKLMNRLCRVEGNQGAQ